MDSPKNPYGTILQLLSQLAKTNQSGAAPALSALRAMAVEGRNETPVRAATDRPTEQSFFTGDETGSQWRREEKIELLETFCKEGYPMAKKYGHFLIGTHGEENYLAIPGRFLLLEQPAGGATGFTLWYPLAGGETLYERLEEMPPEVAEQVYGYWIARLDGATLTVSEV